MKGRVLVAGFATRHVVRSAYAAGYEVCAIDHFCDQDLSWYTKEQHTFEELAEIPDLIEELCSRHTFDCIVTTSGAEDMDLGKLFCGTPSGIAARFCTKTSIQNFFEEHEFPVPPFLPEGNYPAFIKPDTGAGGWRNTLAATADDEAAWKECWPETPYIRQMPVEGIPCSVSCIANGSSARALSLNRQFNRGGEGERRFGFAGAITPFLSEERDRILTMAEDIAAKSGCIGSLGIDFMLTDDGIRTIEINPRFQATLDIVEMSTGVNIFELHRNAARGILPPNRPKPAMTALRSIIFADHDCVVTDDLKSLHPDIADIPWVGTEIEEGSAVLSVYGRGADEDEALTSLDKTISMGTQIYEQMVEETDVLENPAVRAYLIRMVGEEGLTLLENFDRVIEKTDEELAEETEINLNSVRNTLYTLYGKQLAQYRREKNQETGWLTYKWKLRLDNLNDALTDDMEDALEKLAARERYEDENDFYICNNCGIVYTFNDALALEFACRCGTQMEHYDNELLLNVLKKRVAAMKITLGKV